MLALGIARTLSSHRLDVRIPLWCIISSLLLIGLSFDLNQPGLVDFIWTCFAAFPYLLIMIILLIGRAYLATVMAVAVGSVAFLLLAWGLAMSIGQAQGMVSGKWLKLISPFAFLFIQGALFLTALMTVRNVPEMARRPSVWSILGATLLCLYGLSILVGRFIGWISEE